MTEANGKYTSGKKIKCTRYQVFTYVAQFDTSINKIFNASDRQSIPTTVVQYS